MNNDLKSLCRDTLTYLKESGYVLERKVVHAAPPTPPVKPKPPPVKEEVIQPPKQHKPSQKREVPLALDLVRKHLPHLQLIEKIPSPKKVAILVYDREDLPFLKNLARAIQDRFCPVSLIDGEKVTTLDSFSLVLSEKEGDILLKSADFYQSNPNEKKQLWKTICHRLSPKSS